MKNENIWLQDKYYKHQSMNEGWSDCCNAPADFDHQYCTECLDICIVLKKQTEL